MVWHRRPCWRPSFSRPQRRVRIRRSAWELLDKPSYASARWIKQYSRCATWVPRRIPRPLWRCRFGTNFWACAGKCCTTLNVPTSTSSSSGRFLVPSTEGSSTSFACQEHSVAHGHQTGGHALIGQDFGVQRSDRECVEALIFGAGDAATPERIVHGNQASRSQQLEAALVVAVVVLLVCIDEAEIEALARFAGDELVQRRERRRQPKL